MSEPIRVLICDDQASFRNGLRSMLATEASVVLCGEAEDGAAAVNMAESTQPDVVLMDMQMPIMDGYSAMREIRLDSKYKNLPILALTAHVSAQEESKCITTLRDQFSSGALD